MRLTVSKMAEYTGVSVRTLHYYDEKGILKPSEISESGYRYYGDEAVEKMRRILFLRELDFSLEEIALLVKSQGLSPKKSLKRQKKLLELKQKRLKNVIKLAERCIKGEKAVDFIDFDFHELDEAKKAYMDEALMNQRN